MFSRFIYVVACISNLFLFMDVYYSVVWIYPILLIYSLAENIWIVSTFLALVNNAVMNMGVQIPHRYLLSILFGINAESKS